MVRSSSSATCVWTRGRRRVVRPQPLPRPCDVSRSLLGASTATSLPNCLPHAGSGALSHRHSALRAAASRRHEAELARDAQSIEQDPQLAYATVAILVKVDTVELPGAASGREARRLPRAGLRAGSAASETGHHGGDRYHHRDCDLGSGYLGRHRGDRRTYLVTQHSTTLRASRPCDVSLYLSFMPAPVSRIVVIRSCVSDGVVGRRPLSPPPSHPH